MTTDLPKLPGASALAFASFHADDAALLAYLRQLEADERIREYSEEI